MIRRRGEIYRALIYSYTKQGVMNHAPTILHNEIT